MVILAGIKFGSWPNLTWEDRWVLKILVEVNLAVQTSITKLPKLFHRPYLLIRYMYTSASNFKLIVYSIDCVWYPTCFWKNVQVGRKARSCHNGQRLQDRRGNETVWIHYGSDNTCNCTVVGITLQFVQIFLQPQSKQSAAKEEDCAVDSNGKGTSCKVTLNLVRSTFEKIKVNKFIMQLLSLVYMNTASFTGHATRTSQTRSPCTLQENLTWNHTLWNDANFPQLLSGKLISSN